LFVWFGSARFGGTPPIIGFSLGLVAGVLGLISGIKSRRKGQAIIGIVLSILLILYWIFNFIDVFFWEIY